MAMSLARSEFNKHLKDPKGHPDEARVADDQLGMEFLFSKAGIMMSYWYGMLYVVIDGWKQTGLVDAGIDEMIKSPGKRKELLDFRNGLFHFQKDLLPAKQQSLFADRTFVQWVIALSDAFRERLIVEMRRITGEV